MKKRRLNSHMIIKWAKIIKIVFFVMVGVVVILGIMSRVSFALSPGEAKDVAEPLSKWVTSLFTASEYLVGVIAVVMIIIAGVTYTLDLGGGKQIGLAKDMIISTISGVILFMLSAWLLSEIGGENGLFPAVNIPGTDITTTTPVVPLATEAPTDLHLPPPPTPGDESIIPGGGEGLMP